MTTITPVFTHDDLAQLPDDGKRYEIVEGELVASPAPSTTHQRVIWNLVGWPRRAELAGYGRGYVAPLDAIFEPRNVVQPDACFVNQARLEIVTAADIQGAPDLVVEVRSPDSQERDLGVKARLYARYQVPHCWAIDPDRQTERTFALTGAGCTKTPPAGLDATLASPLFPEISLGVADLFEDHVVTLPSAVTQSGRRG